jgi:hypothetical protein
MARKINGNMKMTEVAMIMGDGNPGAIAVIVEMLREDPVGNLLDIIRLDEMDIRGSRLYMLNNDCCQRDLAKFKRTLKMLRLGVFTQEQIRKNLERDYALPFIDDSIKIEGVPSYDDDFGPTHPKWDEWCEAQKESFRRRTA